MKRGKADWLWVLEFRAMAVGDGVIATVMNGISKTDAWGKLLVQCLHHACVQAMG